MRRRLADFTRFNGLPDPRLAYIRFVGGAGSGGGGGNPEPPPSRTFIIQVNKGGNDSTGTGTDEQPFLTIGRAYTLAKTLAGLSDAQVVQVTVGPGTYTENLSSPAFVTTSTVDGDETSVIINGTAAIDAATWDAAANVIGSFVGLQIEGNVTINFTGVTQPGPSFTLQGCALGGTLSGTGDPTNGGNLNCVGCQFFGDITMTGLVLLTIGCFVEGPLIKFFSTAQQNAGWDSIGDASLAPSPLAITCDSTAGNTVVGNINSNLAGPESSLALKGAGTTWQASAGGTPQIVTRTAGAPAPLFLSNAVTLNSLTAAGANSIAGTQATSDGVGNIIWSGGGTRAYYGDGSDGNVNVVGTLTLARDMFYSNLTVPVATTLETNGFRIYVKNTLTVAGTIDNSGAAAVTNTGGAGTAGGTMFGGTAGANGVTATIASGAIAGNNGTNQTLGGGNNSGRGGTGGLTGVAAGGVGGTQNVLVTSFGDTRADPQTTVGAFIGLNPVGGVTSCPSVAGGTGGGSGAAGPVNPQSVSGGGGGAGGPILICCRVLTGAGTIQANGGAGAAGSAGNAGGGAGGGGGQILLTAGDRTAFTGTTTANGGAGGAGIGTGANGANGAAGTVISVQG